MNKAISVFMKTKHPHQNKSTTVAAIKTICLYGTYPFINPNAIQQNYLSSSTTVAVNKTIFLLKNTTPTPPKKWTTVAPYKTICLHVVSPLSTPMAANKIISLHQPSDSQQFICLECLVHGTFFLCSSNNNGKNYG